MSPRLARLAASFFGLAALSACAQPPAATHQDAPMSERYDPAAEAAHEAMLAAQRRYRDRPKPPPEPKVPRHMTVAPTIGVAELRSRILRLADSLRTPADTEAAQVARVMGVSFTPQLMAIGEGETKGVLDEGWPYFLEVYRLRKRSPGKEVRVNIQLPGDDDPRNSAVRQRVCTFELKPFADELKALGYSGSNTRLPFMEQWGFSRRNEALGVRLYLRAELYRADDGTEAGKPCVIAVIASAGNE